MKTNFTNHSASSSYLDNAISWPDSTSRSAVVHWFFLILIACASFALSPALHAVMPAPDGAYNGNNTAEGQDALFSLTTGVGDTAVGFRALYSDMTGNFNTAIGDQALYSDRDGRNNVAIGDFALYANDTGIGNTATGSLTLRNNVSGNHNTASGYQSLNKNVSDDNTAAGFDALYSNTSGTQNTAIGSQALLGATGSYNTATGFQSLFSFGDGGGNVADGWQALYSNSSGQFNTASGVSALRVNTTGNQNTASGVNALYHNNGANNTAEGAFALQNNTSGATNVALGYQAGINLTTGSNNIVIGAGVLGKAGDANKIQIGKQGTQTATYIAGISGKTVASASAVAVFVDNTGKLGTVKSSARYKEQIKPMDKASEAILKLEPVTFRYKQELDPDGVTQFGLIAEQVEKVDPDLVVRDEDGKISTVRYEAVNAMLLNEFLKEHRRAETEADKVRSLEATVAKQQKEIESLSAGLQKVSARLELDRTVPQLVSD